MTEIKLVTTKPRALLFLPYLAPYRIDALNEIGKYYELTVIFLLDNMPGFKYDQKPLRKKLNVEYEVFTSGIVYRKRQIRTGIFKLLKKYNPEVVFSNEFGTTSLLISIYKKLGLLKFEHFSTTSDNVKIASDSNFARRSARKLVLSSAMGIIVYSEPIKEWYRANFKNLTVKVCPNIQDPDKLLCRTGVYDAIAADYKKKHGLENRRILLFIGRIHWMKGLPNYLRIFHQNKDDQDVLVLVGDGPQKQEILDLIKELELEDSVLLPGRFESDELFAWYRLADSFVLPSFLEPFGAVINESLILGTPVLCSKYAGATYFIEEGRNGYVFDPNDADDYAEKVEKCKALKSFGENLMEVNFHDSIYNYFEIYNQAIKV